MPIISFSIRIEYTEIKNSYVNKTFGFGDCQRAEAGPLRLCLLVSEDSSL